jgi:hypothetical protein
VRQGWLIRDYQHQETTPVQRTHKGRRMTLDRQIAGIEWAIKHAPVRIRDQVVQHTVPVEEDCRLAQGSGPVEKTKLVRPTS